MDNLFDNTSVVLLSSEDFDDKEPWRLKDPRCAFVLFFANWCGHCQNLKPEYVKFAEIAQFIKVSAIDADKHEELLKKMEATPNSPINIEGFPTIWLYSQGEPVEVYSGPRKWQALLTAAQKLCNEECECGKN